MRLPATCAWLLPFSISTGKVMVFSSHSPEACIRIVVMPMSPRSPAVGNWLRLRLCFARTGREASIIAPRSANLFFKNGLTLFMATGFISACASVSAFASSAMLLDLFIRSPVVARYAVWACRGGAGRRSCCRRLLCLALGVQRGEQGARIGFYLPDGSACVPHADFLCGHLLNIL